MRTRTWSRQLSLGCHSYEIGWLSCSYAGACPRACSAYRGVSLRKGQDRTIQGNVQKVVNMVVGKKGACKKQDDDHASF